MTSGITTVERHPDRSVVHYHLQKPWGVEDVDGCVEIVHDKVPKLPILPPLPLGSWTEEVSVAGVEQPVLFVFHSYQERGAGPNEVEFLGMFRQG